MKTRDPVTACLQDLSRHKARTLPTVLGVIVGYRSVVIMISIGIGMKGVQRKTLAQVRDPSIIQVHPTGKGAKSAKLNTRAVNKIKELRGVEATTPRLSEENVPTTVHGGRDKRCKAGYASIVGVGLPAVQAMGYKLTQGDQQPDKKDYIYARQNSTYMFEDTKRSQEKNVVGMYDGEWDNKGTSVTPPPYFDIVKTPVTMELDSGKGDGRRVVQVFKAVGRLKEDFAKGEETSMGLLMSLGMYQSLLEQQTQLAEKKWGSHRGYQSALAKVKDVRGVARAELETKKMGFRTSSMRGIREPMEQEARQRQMMLGGLGVISPFVAALGVTNTITMPIPEHARKIGMMKSLGCFVGDVRKIFLLETGCIGLLGGITGLVLSYGISATMDLAAVRLPASASMQIIDRMADISFHLSVIPWWFNLFTTLFPVAIGVGAGYYPANKAVGIPALETIKRD